jgi:hypothetical protein
MFTSRLPLGSEFFKFFTSADQDSEYKKLTDDIVKHMANNYYGLSQIPTSHLHNGSTTNQEINLFQTLIINSDVPSDNWTLKVCKKSFLPHVRFYISSSTRISQWNSPYQLDTLMANEFIANNIADIAYGFDKNTKFNRKNRGYNIFSWLLPSESIYGKEKYVYAKLKGFETFQQADFLSRRQTSLDKIFEFLNFPILSEKIIKIEESQVNEFLQEKTRLICDYLGEEKILEILDNLGLDSKFLRN